MFGREHNATEGRNHASAAHRWAAYNEDRDLANGKAPKSSCRYGRVGYEGDDFISYSTVVARYKENSKGERYAVFLTWPSLSTTQHLDYAHRACRVPQFTVESLAGGAWQIGENIRVMLHDIDVFGEKAKRNWKAHWGEFTHDRWQAQMVSMIGKAEDYAKITEWEGTVPDYAETIAAINKHRIEKCEKFMDPKAVAARERARARRAALRILIPE